MSTPATTPTPAPTTDAAETAEAGLRRLHPLSPLLRGWKFLLAVLVLVSQQAGQISYGGGGGNGGFGPPTLGRWGLLALAALPVAAVYGWLSWRATRFGVEAGDLRIDSGILVRRSRRVRLDRLQAVDVVQPLLGRALGLAELRLEVVGGGSTEAPLAYLELAHARRLRAELLARAAGIDEHTPEAPERVIHEVPPQRILASALLSGWTIFGLLVAAGAVVAAVLTGQPGILFAVAPGLVGAGTSLVRLVIGSWGFTLAASPDGLRIRRGLVETRAQTVPPGRVQALRIVQPWLWRRHGWVSVQMDIAGYGASPGEVAQSSGTLLPVAPRPLAVSVVEGVFTGVRPEALADRGVPARARWLAPVTRRQLAVGADERYLACRRGRFRRELDLVPHERAQSVRVTQGPVQRLLRLATLHLDTVPGPVTVRAEHRDAEEAVRILHAEAGLARRARAGAVPHRWMTVPPPTDRVG